MTNCQTDLAQCSPSLPKRLACGWSGHLLAALCGPLVTLSLAPFNLWPLGILVSAMLLALLHNQPPLTVLWRCWLFGLGLFGSGTSWVYVSIQQHGNAPVPLALFLVVLFSAFLALFLVLMGALYNIATRRCSLAPGWVFAACWTLGEWLRCWLLTGFPWLFLGYAHVDTALSGWAPITGVLGISFITALSGAALYQVYLLRGQQRWRLAAIACAAWLLGAMLQQVHWSQPAGKALDVALIQPDIPQSDKWQTSKFDAIMQSYEALSAPLWSADLLIWPEAAIPRLYQYIPKRLIALDEQARTTSTTLVTGIPFRGTHPDPNRSVYYNSIVAMGQGEGVYFKQRLVPFGEYVPLEQWLRGVITFFDLPMSHMSWGPAGQSPLTAGPWQLAPLICYEVVYPDMVARDSADAHFILNVSNDSWFGHSIGPLQHFQIARMRARENARYLLRGTNNGVTAIIDHQGQVITRATQFTSTVLRGEAIPMSGRTPFQYAGSLPILLICLMTIAKAMWPSRHQGQ